MTVCCYCPASDDLRPYGPGGAPVCLACAYATPAREAATDAAIAAQCSAALAASPIGEVVLTDEGPAPVLHLEPGE